MARTGLLAVVVAGALGSLSGCVCFDLCALCGVGDAVGAQPVPRPLPELAPRRAVVRASLLH